MRTIKVDKKLHKHINIKVNNRKVKILKYKRSSYLDDYINQEVFTIELLTKIYNEVLDNKVVKIELDDKEVLNAEWITCLRKPGLYRFTYKIIGKISVSESNREC